MTNVYAAYVTHLSKQELLDEANPCRKRPEFVPHIIDHLFRGSYGVSSYSFFFLTLVNRLCCAVLSWYGALSL